jgi:hypothetical protein
MAKITETERLAIALLDCVAKQRERYDGINTQIKEMMGDFPTYLQHIDEQTESAMMRLVNDIIGHSDLASYYLYECVGKLGHGGGITCCAASEVKPWKLRNTDDLTKYLLHAKKCVGRARAA